MDVHLLIYYLTKLANGDDYKVRPRAALILAEELVNLQKKSKHKLLLAMRYAQQPNRREYRV